jgi:hypothetical protein
LKLQRLAVDKAFLTRYNEYPGLAADLCYCPPQAIFRIGI